MIGLPVLLVALFAAAITALLYDARKRRRRIRCSALKDASSNKEACLDALQSLRHKHEVASALIDLVEKDGAGSWPPLATHDSLPATLQPYQDIYREISTSLATTKPSLHDEDNVKRIECFRSLMRRLLRERINIRDVKDILASAALDNWTKMNRAQYNALYCNIAVLRHAYRWAIIPVVRVAQDEKVVNFPQELDIPWQYLQGIFGCTAESGNNTANVLHSFNADGMRVLMINVVVPEEIKSTERSFFTMFYDVEAKALPLYCELVNAMIAHERGDKTACLAHLRIISHLVRQLVQVIYQNLTDKNVPKSYWLQYCQGFQGWGVGRVVDGKYIRYDGLSGNHVLAFQILDAFLGIPSYLSDEDMMRYIPARQRKLVDTVRAHSFRSRIRKEGDPRIDEEITKIVNQMRLFRAAHRHRVMPYLKVPAPERQYMTAGKTIGSTGCIRSIDDALKPLDDMLASRLRQTI